MRKGGGRFRSSEREKGCDLRITLRKGLRVDSRKIEGGGPLGREDRQQEADKRHRGAYPAAHGITNKYAKEEGGEGGGDALLIKTQNVLRCVRVNVQMCVAPSKQQAAGSSSVIRHLDELRVPIYVARYTLHAYTTIA